MDTVFIEGLELSTCIGAWSWERQLHQRLRVDLELGVDLRAAAISDDLADAISYAEVADCLIEAATQTEYQLLEALAEHLAGCVQARFAVAWLRLTLTKPGAVPGTRGVGVCIERSAP